MRRPYGAAAKQTEAALAFEIPCKRNLVPGQARPQLRAREAKRPGGRYKTRQPGQTARLTR